MAQEQNRRREVRAPIELKVEYKRLNTFFYDYTKNISKGGTFIKTERPLPVGTNFIFKLYVPRIDQALDLRGQVRWTKKQGDTEHADQGPEAGMGIRFSGENEQLERVARIVERTMVQSLGQLIYAELVGADRPDQEEPEPKE